MKIIYKLTQEIESGNLVDQYHPLKNYILQENEETQYLSDLTVNNAFNFQFDAPVDIECQDSYDGSVNLILNDGKNTPRLINTRFTVRGKNKYEIIDRTGSTDTNIYHENSFQNDTSLFKIFRTFAKIDLVDIKAGGNLNVGNYVFYIKYSDADDNETNIAAQSGMCACYCGTGNKINGAYANYNSNKQVVLKLSNVDTTFDYLYLYYSRYSSDQFELTNTSCFKLIDKISITGSSFNVTITGNENTQEITVEELNQRNENLNSSFAQAQSHNTLFLGNVQKHYIEYENLKDLSLRIYPKFVRTSEEIINNTPSNIYNFVGYWPEEFYRFGIVYIYNNNTESPVFNIRGIIDGSIPSIEEIYDETGERYYLQITEDNKVYSNKLVQDNAVGISYNTLTNLDPNKENSFATQIGVQIILPNTQDFQQELLRQGITGYYIVRQKRIPTILTQAFSVPTMENIGVPLFPVYDLGNQEWRGYLSNVRNFNSDASPTYNKMYVSPNFKNISSSYMCAICPDFTVRQPFFNQLFTGDTFKVKSVATIYGTGKNTSSEQNKDELLSILNYTSYSSSLSPTPISFYIQGVKEDCPNVRLGSKLFSSRAGTAEDLKQFLYNYGKKSTLLENWNDDNNENMLIVRGIYSPYIALQIPDNTAINNYLYSIINIYIPGFNPIKSYQNPDTQDQETIKTILEIRTADNSPYFAISDKQSINSTSNIYYRGDCYNCQFTQRFFRNFQDPTAPNNDQVVKTNSYEQIKYEGGILKNWENINRGDINAIKLGAWLTFNIKSSNNLNIRSIDDTYTGEIALTGNTRAFYPYRNYDCSGNNKIPESQFINEGFSQTLGVLKTFAYISVPYLKNTFTNRIYYSNIAVNDGYQNGYRVFKGTNYRDYTIEYGQITKLVEYNGNLVIVFEHGIGIVPIGQAQESSTEFINTTNKLPFAPTIISGQYGSIFKDSVIKTPTGIYGVDTTIKKIWKYSEQGFSIISELLIDSFLQENINFTESDNDPLIAIKNCKAFYNSQKSDIMFTFYNNSSTDETAWNICYNEKTQKWTTFYSWIPLFGCNVNKNFLSIDRERNRDCLKFNYLNTLNYSQQYLTLLNGSYSTSTPHLGNPYIISAWQNSPSDTIDFSKVEDHKVQLQFKSEYATENIKNIDGEEDEGKNYIEVVDSTFGNSYLEIIRDKGDNYSFYTLVIPLSKYGYQIKKLGYIDITFKLTTTLDRTIYDTVTLYYIDTPSIYTENNNIIYYKPSFINYIYKHGSNNIYNYQDKILPTFWYDKQHPFEFEFIVSKDLPLHKIFNKLEIISNNVPPESFHYEIVGDCFDFSENKKEMYFRQEATKALYHQLGSNISFDTSITEDSQLQNSQYLWDISRDQEQLYPDSSYFYGRSTILPLVYYNRLNYINSIEDYYESFISPNKDFSNLSGSEIVYTNKEYHIVDHSKAVDIKKYGRLRGNMHYQEDRWFVQINPINLVQFNETSDSWIIKDNRYFPSILINSNIPNDIHTTSITNQDIPKFLKNNFNYTLNNIKLVDWNNSSNRQEIKVKDKYIRIKIRYSGDKVATIHTILTYYTEIN